MKRLLLILKVLLPLLMVTNYVYAYDFEIDGIAYNILPGSANEVEVTSNKKNVYLGNVNIPSEVYFSGITYKVTAIGDRAFYTCGHNIKAITMPNSIIRIGNSAFKSLWDISTIEIPNSVISIGDNAFNDCQNLESIVIPNNVTTIGNEAFDYCLKLQTVTLGNSITEIGKSAFSRCSILKSINIPNSVESIGDYAFTSCTQLPSIDIPNSVKTIGKCVFSECTNLKTVTLSQSISIINNQLFYNCKNLLSINIPNSITAIGDNAFSGCNKLTSIVSEIESPFKISNILFSKFTFNNGILTVPRGKKSSYQSTDGWNLFQNIIEAGGVANYSLSIKAIGNGTVTYGGNSINNQTKEITLDEGTSATITFTPDNGYRLQSVKVNNTDVTTSVSNNQFTINSIRANTTVEVVFEAIPVTTYTLSITASGNGSATYNGTSAKNNTKSFTLNEGTSGTITFSPDNGCRIKSVKVNSADVTSSVSNDSYTVSNIKANTMVEVEFEAIPIPTYTLSVKATGNGSATYNGTTAKNNTKSFTLNEGTSSTITFAPDNGYRIKSVKVNSVDVTSSVSNNSYTVSNIKANTTVEVEFEAIPIPTYTLSIKASGNGSATYSRTTAKNNTKSFTLNEGTSSTITFAPDNGYRIKSVKVNSVDVTSSVSNNSYTVNNIKANTTVEVEFEAIPIPTYTLSVKATGNGSATYSGTTAKNNTQTFTLNEGTSATISFSPDNGYRIKSVKVNSADVTSSISNNSYTVSNIKANATVEVEFEAIPIPTYTLSIKASGNGSATYNGTTAKNNTQSFTLNEGTNAAITFAPDNGYRIKSVKVNSTEVTTSVSNNQYTISNIKTNTTLEVEFEAIPIPTYTLSIKASGNGSATYSGTTAKNNTQTFTLNEGTSATITFTPDNGYRIKSVKVNSVDVTSRVSNNSYTVSNIKANTTLEVEFEAIPVVINTYTLSVKSSGNGSATYSGTTAKNNTQSFTLNEGTSATITFAPDNGYRIKSVKVNSVDVTSSVSNNTYIVSNIKANTTVEVEFEAIPIPTYTLYVKASGNGSATFNNTTAKNDSKTFTLNEGTSATIAFSPDNGYRIKSVKVNSTDVTSSVSNNSYTVSNIKANTTVEVEYEAIPINSYTLKYVVDGVMYQTYQLQEGATIVPEAKPTKEGYTFSGWSEIPQIMPSMDVTVTGSFIVNKYKLTYQVDGVEYKSYDVEYGATITPETFPTKDGYTFSGWSEIPKTMPAKDVTVVGTFTKDEPIIKTYTLTITASGNGSATFNNTTAKNDSKTFTLNEGTSATIAFTPDNGYRIKSVKLNSADVTSSVSNNSYTVSNIKDNTTVNVEFEAIPTTDTTPISGDKFEVDGITYVVNNDVNTVSVTSGSTNYSGNVVIPSQVIYEGKTYSVTSIGVMAFDGCSGLTSITIPESVKSIGDEAFKHCSGLTSITIPESVEGIGWRAFYGCGLTSITILGSPWIEEAFNGCPLTSVHISDLDKFLRIEYERPWEFNDPLNWAHHLFLNGEEIKDLVIPSTITKINDGALSGASSLTSVTIPNSVTSIGGLAFAGCSSLSSVVSEIENPYVISNTVFDGIPSDAKLIVPKGKKAAYQATEGWNVFAIIVEAGGTEPDQPSQIHINEIIYKVTGSGEVEVVSAENGVTSITIPSSVSYNNTVYKVTSIAKDAFENCDHLSAVIWEPEAQFNAKVNNPNFLLYVSDEKYASRSVKNVVVNGVAESIELTDAANGNDFYCPRAFSARNIVYSHNYQMETGIGDSRGWETIVLPFDVQKYTHATKGELESFTTWSKGSNKKPFWLFELTASGYKDVAGIKANTPYIISMPNNPQYLADYVIIGLVTFSAENVEVKASDDMLSAKYQDRTFVPNYTNKTGDNYLALNVNSYYVTNPSTDIDGSKFIKGLRAVHPFEAYMTTTSNTRSIDVMDGMTTAIRNIMMTAESKDVIKVYDTKGVLVKTAKANDDLRKGLAAGVYIVNGKKMIIK